MPDQRHSEHLLDPRTSRHASATSEVVSLPEPLHVVAVEPDTDAATGYELPPRQQPLETAADQGGATAEVPGSGPPPPPPACRTGDEQGLDAARPAEYRSSSSSTAARTIANGGR